MDRDKRPNRKPALLLLRILFLCMVILVPDRVMAERSFLLQPGLDDLQDGALMLAPLGRHGAGIQLSFHMPTGDAASSVTPDRDGTRQPGESALHMVLSVHVPW